MAFPGSHPHYYLQRGAFTNLSPSQAASGLHAPPGMRPMLNPSVHHNPPANNPGPLFSMADHHRHSGFGHSIHMGMSSSSAAVEHQPPPPPQMETPMVKKKRGRPRKYAPEGQVSLGLSPMPSSSSSASNRAKDSTAMTDPNAPKRARGRPPGTGRKQRLANLGEWMNTSAGLAFAPHVISVEAGEDVVSKVMAFSQQRPRVLCVMSGTGTVSSVTLRQPATTEPSLTFEGRFEILSLGGSYLVNEGGGPKSRTGGLSVSLSGPEGHVIGGGIGMLIAASLVQVVACSFVYGGVAKPNNTNKIIKQENKPKEEEHDNSEMETTPTNAQEAPVAQQTPQNFSDYSGNVKNQKSQRTRTDL
ncbi:AT-hook motif nuclear-localized protein 5 [Raphanus sativus]|nr:AT-hook motif nuclear-localized protein 5 [Raphanus sativus]